MHIFYLHGFTSSPRSKKGTWLKDRFAQHGIELHLPDLNVPSFGHLRMSAMLDAVRAEIAALPPGDVTLIGSSLGGAVAVNMADRAHKGGTAEGLRVKKLILLAPAFDIRANWERRIGEDGIAAWREHDSLQVYNYAQGGETAIDYGFLEDVMRYDTYGAHIDIPVLCYHGINDDTVPPTQSERFAASRPNVDLRLLESDHELLDQTDVIWTGTTSFLAL
jgi:hypothetical protein